MLWASAWTLELLIPNKIFCFKSVQVFLGNCDIFYLNYVFNNNNFTCWLTVAIFAANSIDAEEISCAFYLVVITVF